MFNFLKKNVPLLLESWMKDYNVQKHEAVMVQYFEHCSFIRYDPHIEHHVSHYYVLL